MRKLSKILGWVLYLSSMCVVISGLIIVLWEYPETSFLVELFKIFVLTSISFLMAFMGVTMYTDLK